MELKSIKSEFQLEPENFLYICLWSIIIKFSFNYFYSIGQQKFMRSLRYANNRSCGNIWASGTRYNASCILKAWLNAVMQWQTVWFDHESKRLPRVFSALSSESILQTNWIFYCNLFFVFIQTQISRSNFNVWQMSEGDCLYWCI